MFLMLLQCKPLSFFWTRVGPDPPAHGSCIDMNAIIAMTYVCSVFAAICDLTAGILPIFLVWNLNMNRSMKFAVVGILSMACMSVSIYLMALSVSKANISRFTFSASAAVIARFPFVQTFADPEFLCKNFFLSQIVIIGYE